MLFLLNFFFLQWFGIRLAKIINVNNNKTYGFCLMYKVKPLTGWWNSYNKNHKTTNAWYFRK